jgi:hypothetical protein
MSDIIRAYHGLKPIPVFYNDIPRSVRATMLFPVDEEKARTVVGWALAREKPCDGHQRTVEELVAIAQDAAAFVFLKEQVRQGEEDGVAVGEVIKVLFAMVGTSRDRAVASIDSAIAVVENEVVFRGSKVSRSWLRSRLKGLQPVLHLWGAWSLAERRWPANRTAADKFIQDAESLRLTLKAWNSSRSGSGKYLSGSFVSPYLDWQPNEDDKGLGAVSLRADDVPVRRPPGRRKLRPD